MANDAANVANSSYYKDQLFALYQRARYNELICSSLMSEAVNIEKWVRGSVLLLVAISLLTGSTSYLNPPILTPIWAVLSALATLLAVYSLVVASGAKQFFWFGLSSRFLALAERVEFFAVYVRIGKVEEDELIAQWQSFSSQLADLLHVGGVELRDYTQKNAKVLTERLEEALKQEGKAQA